MNSFFPTSHGFRLASRRPSIPLAELAWRWSFAAAALTLSWLFLFEYLDSLRVTRGDRLLLISRQPVLVARAIHRIFQGSAFRFTEAGVLLGLGLAIAWIVLASLGRMAIVNSVLEEFGLAPRIKGRGGFSSLLALNVLRTAVMLAAFAGLMGATLLASSFWSSTHISAQDASRVFSLLVFFVRFGSLCNRGAQHCAGRRRRCGARVLRRTGADAEHRNPVWHHACCGICCRFWRGIVHVWGPRLSSSGTDLVRAIRAGGDLLRSR